MQKTRSTFDYFLYYLIIIMVVFGLVMVYNASSFKAEMDHNDQFYLVKQQLKWAAVGFLAMTVAGRFKYENYRPMAKYLFLISLILLVLVHVPGIGSSSYGASRWIRIGRFRFQPSELAKPAFIVFLSLFLERKGIKIRSFTQGVIPALILVGLVFGLIILQKDLGTAFIIAVTGIILIFLAGIRYLHFIPTILSVVGVVSLAIFSNEYRLRRLVSAFNPWSDPLGTGYQAIQSLYALGAGGIQGLGLGNSIQKRLYLPFAHNDFIYAIICEELGFIGGAILILGYLLIGIRGIRIARRAPDKFGFYLASGLTFSILLQAFINILVVTATLPVTGITLPLISYGGTSLMITMASVGILLNISRFSVEPEKKK